VKEEGSGGFNGRLCVGVGQMSEWQGNGTDGHGGQQLSSVAENGWVV
jgi:hypothetical protein